jgi:hypothetical protein
MALTPEQIQEEVRRLGRLPGVARAGACLPDRSSITHPQESEAADRFITRTIWDIFKLLELQKIDVQRCLWHYENGQIFGLLAKDRLALLVVVNGVVTQETASAMNDIFNRLQERSAA